jgi:hypothetical protein
MQLHPIEGIIEIGLRLLLKHCALNRFLVLSSKPLLVHVLCHHAEPPGGTGDDCSELARKLLLMLRHVRK